MPDIISACLRSNSSKEYEWLFLIVGDACCYVEYLKVTHPLIVLLIKRYTRRFYAPSHTAPTSCPDRIDPPSA
jgi:hypothetical protein